MGERKSSERRDSESMAREERGWRRIREEGVEWEARVIPGPSQTDPGLEGDDEVLEFRSADGGQKPRRLAVRPGSLREMTDEQLHRAYVQARPIGGDHYGRPGKHMSDTG